MGLWVRPNRADAGRGHDQALVVDGQHRVEGPTVMKGGNDLHRFVDLAHGDDHGPIAHGVGHGLAPLAADNDIDAETIGCGQEILGPVRLCGQEEEYPGHHP